MANCVVSGTLLDPSSNPISGAVVTFSIETPLLDASSNLLGTQQVSTTTAANGTWSLSLSQGLSGIITMGIPSSSAASPQTYVFSVILPNAPTASFSSVWADATNLPTTGSFPVTFANIAGTLLLAQLPTLTSTDIWVGNGSNAATAVALSGAATLSNTGVLTLSANTVANSNLAQMGANTVKGNNTGVTANATDIPISSLLSSLGAVTSLTGDVSGTGPGATTTTVNTVGGSTAANIHAAEGLANAGTASNIAGTLVKRDNSNNFSAGTITAALTGTASGNTTYTANNHGIVVSSATNTMTVIAPDASTSKVLVSGGSSSDPSWSLISNSSLTGSAAITNANLANMASSSSTVGTVKGNISGSATTPSDITLTSANTVSTAVYRDGSGNFSAGTVTAAVTGTASGNTTYTANNHGVVVSSTTNAMTVIAPDASTSKVLVSGGSSADPSWSLLTNSSLSGSAAITNANLANMASSSATVGTVKGNISGSSSTPSDITLTSANTVSTAVYRDSSGNFSAGTITASLAGHASADLQASNNLSDVSSSSSSFNNISPITTTGDLIVGSGVNTAARLALGGNNQVLMSNGTTAVWSSSAASSPPVNAAALIQAFYNLS